MPTCCICGKPTTDGCTELLELPPRNGWVVWTQARPWRWACSKHTEIRPKYIRLEQYGGHSHLLENGEIVSHWEQWW